MPALERLALRYVERYATTRAKLRDYLNRKLRERGWAGEEGDPVERILTRFTELRYVDDRGFAMMRSEALSRRGYGARRVSEALRAAGIDEADGAEARDAAEEAGWQSALAFARRRRIGCYAAAPMDQDARRKAIGAMIRAGHSFEVARRIAASMPGEIPDFAA